MKAALEHLLRDHARSWHVIVWAGPGYGAMLGTVMGMEAGIRILLEPHPELYARLEHRLRAGTGVRLSSRALWTTSGTRPFHLMSDPLRSTLMDPEGLRRLWPNLQRLSSVDAELEDLETLANEEGIQPDGANLLILDATGAEEDLLAGTPPDVLARFSHILAGMPVRPVAAGATAPPLPPVAGFSTSPVLEQSAGTRWFLLERQGASAGLPPGALHAELSRLLEEEERLRSELSNQADERDSLREERDALAATVEAVRGERDAARQEAEARQAESATLAGERDGLRGERDALAATVEEVRGERDQARAQRDGLQLELDAARHQLSERQASLDRAESRVATLEAELATAGHEREEARTGLAQVSARAAPLEQQLAQLQGERDEARDLVAQLRSNVAEHEQLASQARDECARLAIERQGQEASLAQLRQQQEESQAAAARAAELASGLQAQLREARQTANVASRMQALRENDLQDLQQRYEESRAVQEHQHQLLVKLGERLGDAAAHFHQLADQRAQAADTGPTLSLHGEAVAEPVATRPAASASPPRKRRKPGGKT